MGLFEKALTFQKEKRGLYHKLLEYKKKWEEEPKSLFLKAKKFRERLQEATDQIEVNQTSLDLPDFEVETQSPKEKDPEFYPIELNTKQDFFENWEQEAKQEIQKLQYEEQNQELEKKLMEDDTEILTLPEEIHIASQKRIDYYLAVFDINDELQQIDDFEEFLENLCFLIQEQLGTRMVLAFGNKNFPEFNSKLDFMFEVGYRPVSFSIPIRDPIFDIITSSDEVYYVSHLEKGLKDQKSIFYQQKEVFQEFSVILLLKQSKEIYSLILLSKPLEQPDYVLDDLEFLRVLNKISLSRIEHLKKQSKLQQEIKSIQTFNHHSNVLFNFMLDCSNKKKMDDVYDLLQNLLHTHFGITMFSFIVIEPNYGYYKLFAGENISVDSIQKFHLDVNSDLVSLISNLTTIHPLMDFKNYQDIIDNYSETDITLMQHFIIIPMVHLNWLVGFIVIHKLKEEWNPDYEKVLLYLSIYLASLVTNLVINEEKKLLFRDAFSPLRKKIELAIQKAEETQTNFSVIDLKIKNFKKMLSTNSISKLDQSLRKVIEVMNSTLYKQDSLIRLAQARFIIILSNKNKEEAQIYLKKLLVKFNELNLYYDSPIQPTYSYEIFTYPKDADSLKKFLALIEI